MGRAGQKKDSEEKIELRIIENCASVHTVVVVSAMRSC